MCIYDLFVKNRGVASAVPALSMIRGLRAPGPLTCVSKYSPQESVSQRTSMNEGWQLETAEGSGDGRKIDKHKLISELRNI